MNKKLPRDVFIDTIYERAKDNKNIIFMSADLGAQALDRFREELSDQFIHPGISEQSMIDIAAGLAMQGNNVICYAMAPFITSRCLEQIKVAVATQGLSLTLVGVGVGYGYDNAGPTHYATEDIAWMSSMVGMEIYSPADNKTVLEIANKCVDEPGLRYIRLDRKFLPEIKKNISKKYYAKIGSTNKNLIITTGFMTSVIGELRDDLNVDFDQIDLFRNFPIEGEVVNELKKYEKIITIEEHFLTGGVSSKISEVMSDNFILTPHLRLGIKEKYYFENGGRSYLHKLAELDSETLKYKIENYLRP